MNEYFKHISWEWSWTNKQTLLIVDDNKTNLQIVKELCQCGTHSTHHFITDGSLRWLNRDPFDLAISICNAGDGWCPACNPSKKATTKEELPFILFRLLVRCQGNEYACWPVSETISNRLTVAAFNTIRLSLENHAWRKTTIVRSGTNHGMTELRYWSQRIVSSIKKSCCECWSNWLRCGCCSEWFQAVEAAATIKYDLVLWICKCRNGWTRSDKKIVTRCSQWASKILRLRQFHVVIGKVHRCGNGRFLPKPVRWRNFSPHWTLGSAR